MFRITQLLPSCEEYLEHINKPFVIELEYILVAQHNWLKPKSLIIVSHITYLIPQRNLRSFLGVTGHRPSSSSIIFALNDMMHQLGIWMLDYALVGFLT